MKKKEKRERVGGKATGVAEFLSPSWCDLSLAASSSSPSHSKHHFYCTSASKGTWYNGQFPSIKKERKERSSLKPREGG